MEFLTDLGARLQDPSWAMLTLLLPLLILAAFGTVWLLKHTPLPNPWLIGPMFLSIAVGASGLARITIPPLTSQYLNLTKNSSLAVAIAYPELVSIFAGTALNQVGKEIEMLFMMMSVYLFFSITTALFMNWFNARFRLVER